MSDDMYDERLAALEARLSALDAAEPRAAPLGFFQVAPGESVLADHMNTAVLQGVIPFASAAARSAAIPSPAVGTYTVLKDSGRLERWNGSTWVRHPNVFTVGTLLGTYPAAEPPPVIISCTTVVTTNASGIATIGFGAFSSVVQNLVMTSGSADGGFMQVGQNGAPSVSSVQVVCLKGNGTPHANIAVRVNYIATGI